MGISTIEQNQIPEGTIPMTWSKVMGPSLSTTQVVLVPAGDHPRMKLVSGQVTSLTYDTAPGSITVEDADGNNATTATSQSATVFTPVEMVLDQFTIFEADEPVVLLPVEGNAANGVLVTANFVNC